MQRTKVLHEVLRQALLWALLFQSSAWCQTPIPKQEVRAVWIATVPGLDWPSSSDPVEQRRSLREIVANLADARFNTIFFQVRGRGDAMYRSHLEPWAQQLTGTLGRDPGWDPLQFIIEEAHARGMEVHAWFNTFLIKSGATKPVDSAPRHVILDHPDWLHLVKGEWWLDPGIPPARKYTVSVALDIVRGYDIDGIHFDFLRYPGESFPDQMTYSMYGAGQPKDDWRRENVNKFVREFHDAAAAIKPFLKIGSAPIGIYNHDAGESGLYSYDNLYQDSRRWLQEGKQDYLVPQVYWALGHKAGNPDFGVLARDWSKNSFGRQVIIGVGAYKPEVYRELPALVDTTRQYRLAGNSFFRYENIERSLSMGGRYRYYANIPAMPWRDSIPPGPPLHLKVSNDSDGVFRLLWQPPAPAKDGDTAKCYDVYRSPVQPVQTGDPRNLIRIVAASCTTLVDTIRQPTSAKYYYTVTALDKGNNESQPTNEESIVVPEIVELGRRFSHEFKLRASYPEPASDIVYLAYELRDSGHVHVVITDASSHDVVDVVDEQQGKGRYVAAADVSHLEEGMYLCELTMAGARLKRPLTISR